MIWQGHEYVPSNTVKLRGAVNVLGLTLGDVTNNGEETAAAYNDSDYIQIIDPGGKELWKVAERFGGSTLYYQLPRDNLGGITNPKYYPMRIVVRKNKTGNDSEVIAVKNHDVAFTVATTIETDNSMVHSLKDLCDPAGTEPVADE